MKILVLNCGSSSIKYQLLEMTDEQVLASGSLDRIGQPEGEFKYSSITQEKKSVKVSISDCEQGLVLILSYLINPKDGVVKDKNEIAAVGHRIVHGAEAFSESVIINDEVLKSVEECSSLAPLHNPANLKGIYAAQKFLPNAIQCGTFDTAFHQTIPQYSYLYPIPYSYYDQYKIRKYGFHGTSHKYISRIAAEKLGFNYTNCKIITCHLGNGASVAAIENGKSIDTSMGFTPLEGLMMGTRSGNFDVGAMLYIMRKEGIPGEKIEDLLNRSDDLLNKQSGMLGVCGFSDMRDAQTNAEAGDEKCDLALDMYAYRVKKYIGSYTAAMGGVDIIVFSGGIGENNVKIREKICSDLEFMGIILNYDLNQKIRGELQEISAHYSKVKVIIVPTNEELVIARETLSLVLGKLYNLS
jgi:acetate kinase